MLLDDGRPVLVLGVRCLILLLAVAAVLVLLSCDGYPIRYEPVYRVNPIPCIEGMATC